MFQFKLYTKQNYLIIIYIKIFHCTKNHWLLDPSKFGAKNEMEDNLNSIISFIEESWDSNSDKADDSITTSDRFMFVPNSAVFFLPWEKSA